MKKEFESLILSIISGKISDFEIQNITNRIKISIKEVPAADKIGCTMGGLSVLITGCIK